MSNEEETKKFSSPACSAHEMDDRYMGFAGREELLLALNELLEAERAGALVTLRTVRQLTDPAFETLITAIHHDEARWCAMLTELIKNLGGTPSQKIGAFNEKAMAINDIPSRLIFLNRGQAWVVRKLEALLSTVRDDHIHAALKGMLISHQRNIDLVKSNTAEPNI